MKKTIPFLLILLLIFTLVACTTSNTPEDAANQWVRAMLEGDGEKVADLTCQEFASYFGEIANYSQDSDAPEISEFSFKTIESTDKTAAVEITDETGQPLIVFMLLEKDGNKEEWKFCGFDPKAIEEVFDEIIEALENP